MQTICLQINVCHGFDNFNSFENYGQTLIKCFLISKFD